MLLIKIFSKKDTSFNVGSDYVPINIKVNPDEFPLKEKIH